MELYDLKLSFFPRYTIILDPGLPTDYSKEEYPPFYEAKELDILVKHPNGKLVEGKVWNRKLVS